MFQYKLNDQDHLVGIYYQLICVCVCVCVCMRVRACGSVCASMYVRVVCMRACVIKFAEEFKAQRINISMARSHVKSVF